MTSGLAHPTNDSAITRLLSHVKSGRRRVEHAQLSPRQIDGITKRTENLCRIENAVYPARKIRRDRSYDTPRNAITRFTKRKPIDPRFLIGRDWRRTQPANQRRSRFGDLQPSFGDYSPADDRSARSCVYRKHKRSRAINPAFGR